MAEKVGLTADLVESNGSQPTVHRVYDTGKSYVGLLPRNRDQRIRAQRSLSSMGLLYLHETKKDISQCSLVSDCGNSATQVVSYC